MDIAIKTYRNDLRLLMALSGRSEAFVLQQMVDTAQMIFDRYKDRIKEKYPDPKRPFSRLRVFGDTKLYLRYSFYLQNNDGECILQVFVKQIKGKKFEYFISTDITRRFLDEEICQALI